MEPKSGTTADPTPVPVNDGSRPSWHGLIVAVVVALLLGFTATFIFCGGTFSGSGACSMTGVGGPCCPPSSLGGAR